MRVGPNPVTRALIKRGKRRGDHEKMEVEIGVMNV